MVTCKMVLLETSFVFVDIDLNSQLTTKFHTCSYQSRLCGYLIIHASQIKLAISLDAAPTRKQLLD